jgi:hypothetical protein
MCETRNDAEASFFRCTLLKCVVYSNRKKGDLEMRKVFNDRLLPLAPITYVVIVLGLAMAYSPSAECTNTAKWPQKHKWVHANTKLPCNP